jgi:hypothetical protein
LSASLTERWSGDEIGQNSPDAKNYTLTGERVLDVVVTDPANWNSFAVAGWLSDPNIRAQYAVNGVNIDFYLKCNNLKIKKTSPVTYEVSASYFTTSQLGQSPLNNPPSISFSQVANEEPVDQDTNGNPIGTILGEDFDPPMHMIINDPIVRVSRNLASYDDTWAQSFRNTVNSLPWNGYPAGSVRVNSIAGDSVLDASFSYWKVTGEFQIRGAPPGKTVQYAWYRRVKAQGFMVKVGSMVQRGVDQNGQDTPVPVNHDTTTGAQLAWGATPQWYYFQLYPLADLNALGLI